MYANSDDGNGININSMYMTPEITTHFAVICDDHKWCVCFHVALQKNIFLIQKYIIIILRIQSFGQTDRIVILFGINMHRNIAQKLKTHLPKPHYIA